MTKQESIIRVHFNTPQYNRQVDIYQTDFYFGSLSAIYEQFTPEQVGCKVNTLWNANIDFGHPYTNRLCKVSRESFCRKPRKRPSQPLDNEN